MKRIMAQVQMIAKFDVSGNVTPAWGQIGDGIPSPI